MNQYAFTPEILEQWKRWAAEDAQPVPVVVKVDIPYNADKHEIPLAGFSFVNNSPVNMQVYIAAQDSQFYTLTPGKSFDRPFRRLWVTVPDSGPFTSGKFTAQVFEGVGNVLHVQCVQHFAHPIRFFHDGNATDTIDLEITSPGGYLQWFAAVVDDESVDTFPSAQDLELRHVTGPSSQQTSILLHKDVGTPAVSSFYFRPLESPLWVPPGDLITFTEPNGDPAGATWTASALFLKSCMPSFPDTYVPATAMTDYGIGPPV